jgi:membrane-bound serine protease (ClpP class)
MKKKLIAIAIGIGVLSPALTLNAAPALLSARRAAAADTTNVPRQVHVISITGPINPVAAEYILDSVDEATDAKAEGLIIELDTPGGLMESTHIITKAMLASEIPIVIYVSPSGARAASAGVFMTYAAHLAAMAPSTNIGAAHPVNMGGGKADSANTMMEKVTNDAVAQIKAVAEKRGRNVAWAEEAVRKSVSITEKEALAKNVINFIAPNLDSLLITMNGREVELVNRKAKMQTAGAKIIRHEMSWRHKLLDKISDPNIAYLLLMLGIYGIFFELSNPGAILPGVVGGIFLILAFYALQTLPVNWAGLLLILFAIILFILEVKVTSFGILTIGGVVAMFLGSVMLFNRPPTILEPAVKVSLQVIIVATLATAAFFAVVLGLVVKAHQQQATTGREGMLGEIGAALTAIAPEGRVQVHGEIWHAHSEAPIEKGQPIKVVGVKGLQVKVEKLNNA